MSEILQTNVFFMITAVAVVIVTIFIIVALFYLIKILRAVSDIAERVREGSEVIADDVANVREGIVSGRFFRTVVNRAQAAAGFGGRKGARRKRKTDDETGDDDGETAESNDDSSTD